MSSYKSPTLSGSNQQATFPGNASGSGGSSRGAGDSKQQSHSPSPFTKNQDANDLARHLRRTSISQSSSGGFTDHAIDEEDEDNSEDEARRASQFRRFPSMGSPTSPKGPAIQPNPSTSSSLGGGGRALSSSGSTKEPSIPENASPPEEEFGLGLKPSLIPTGADHQNPVQDQYIPDPDSEYAKPKIGRRSSLTHEGVQARARGIVRTYSMGQQKRRPNIMNKDTIMRARRLSHDAKQDNPRRFIVDVEETMRLVLEQEDTDGNFQINVTDGGPKVMSLGTAESNGYKGVDIRGTYMLSNLLQELALAKEHGRKRIVLDESRLTENPVDRLSRMISQTFWHNLTRRIDGDGLEAILSDPKNRSKSRNPRIYVPQAEPEMIEYYQNISKQKPDLKLSVHVLPPMDQVTPEYVRDLNDKPGLLALAMKKSERPDGSGTELRGVPFVVPGARFNELYNWDSYFISLGLVVDNMIDLAKGTVDHFVFEIKHYGKILNGNRTYYLLRAQPPFLTDMALQVYTRLDPQKAEENQAWLKTAIQAAIKEYHTVWMSEPRYDPKTGLSRFRPQGLGVPPETEASHFTHILRPYAEKYGISINEFTRKYNYGEIKEPQLDEYFLHDRAVRESGHDTSYRLEKRCANLATIDLNSLLYKYEVDIATAIRELFDDNLSLEDDFLLHAPLPPNYAQKGAAPSAPSRSIETPQTSAEWFARAAYRKQQVDNYCWNDGMGLYYDYDTVKDEQNLYESVTAYWAMWAGMASDEQAEKLVRQSLKKFEAVGGLVPGTEESRGKTSLERPNRQWDYPFAWPPHQILAWVGFERYGYLEEARRLAYRWLYMMTVAFVDFNGVVPEKFDAVKLSHMVDAEYGNQGVDFKFVPREGFGWMNASFQVGLTFLTTHMRRAVAACQHPDDFFKSYRGQ